MHRSLSLMLLVALTVVLMIALPNGAPAQSPTTPTPSADQPSAAPTEEPPAPEAPAAPAPEAPAAEQPAPAAPEAPSAQQPAPSPAPEQPAPTPAPEQPAPSAPAAPSTESPAPAPAPEQPAPPPTQPAPEQPTPTPAPEQPAPAPTEGQPAPATATPEQPAPAPAPAAPPSIITSIQVVGNQHIPTKDIEAAISSKVGEVYSDEQVKRDHDAIIALGWFAEVPVERAVTESGIALTFRVVENPVITDIRFEGNTVINAADLLKVMKTKPGQVFNSQLLRQDSEAIMGLYRSRGYILALVLGRSMSPEGVLTIGLAEGVIEAIRITGNTRTKDRTIRHYIRVKPGDVYNDQKVAADVSRLASTRWFESVQRTAEVGTEPGKVILVITIVERKRTGQATVGGGYSSVQGLVGFVDLTKENLGGTGQAVTVRTEFGGRDSYEFYYRNPWIMTPETRLNLGLYNRLVVSEAFINDPETGTRETKLYDQRRTGGSVTLGRPLSDRTIAYLGFRSDRVSLSGLTEEEKEVLTGPAFAPSNVTSITTALASDTRDSADYPHRGGFLQLSAEFAGLLGGDTDFNKFSGDTRRYFPMGKKNTLAFRLLLGTISGSAPYLEQFMVGGTESLRGFEPDRFVGSNLGLLNSEFRMPFGRNIIGVLFVDAGDAWGGPVASDPLIQGDPDFTLHVGYGFGVRVATPIGPLRLDLGFSQEGTQTHFGLSQMF